MKCTKNNLRTSTSAWVLWAGGLALVVGCESVVVDSFGVPFLTMRFEFDPAQPALDRMVERLPPLASVRAMAWPVYDGAGSDAATVCENFGGGSPEAFATSFFASVRTSTAGRWGFTLRVLALAKDEPQTYGVALLDREDRGAYIGRFELPPPARAFQEEFCGGQPSSRCARLSNIRDCQSGGEYAPEGAQCYSGGGLPPVEATFSHFIEDFCAAAAAEGS